MIELININYVVENEKGILININLKIDEHLTVITGPKGKKYINRASKIYGVALSYIIPNIK